MNKWGLRIGPACRTGGDWGLKKVDVRRWATGVCLAIFLLLAGQASAATICGYNDKAGKLSGVSGTCGTSPQEGELSTANTTYFFDKGVTFSCGSNYCMLKKSNELCAAAARIGGRVGEHSCNEQAACASAPISSDSNIFCTGNQVCCVAKSGASTEDGSSSAGSGSGLTSPAGTQGTVAIPDPLGGATIPSVIGNIIRVFTGIAGSIALVVFVLGGFFFMLSEGDPGKVKNAKAMMTNGAIGIILIFGAYMLTATIINAILVQNT